MNKNHKITYAVKEDKTAVIVINEVNTVADVLAKIQAKEHDQEYTHLFIDGSEIDHEEILFEYYDPWAIFVASKTESVPDDLYTTLKTLSTISRDTIGEDETILPTSIPKTGKKHNFRIHTSLTLNSMLQGDLIDGLDINMDVEEVKNIVLNWIKTETVFDDIIKDLDDIENLEVHLYLPCGAPFLSGTFSEWENSLAEPISKVLYVIVTRKFGDLSTEIIENVCNCSTEKMKKILSPLFNSTSEGYTQIASLLGYFYYGGSFSSSEILLRNLSIMTGFVPLINLLYTIMIQKKVNGRMIASITAPLHTFIREKVTDSNNQTAFSYSISLMSYISNIKVKNLPSPNLIAYSYNKGEDEGEEEDVQKYLTANNKQFNFIVLWDKDFQSLLGKKTFQVTKKPKPVNIKQLDESLKSEMSLKPVSPMTILYLHSVSFIRTTKSDSINTKVGLFIRKKPKKEENKQRNIVFIDPEEGVLKEVDYEDLAKNIDDDSVDENIKSKGDTSLQQIIFVCLDTSLSMRNLLNGRTKKHRDKLPSRKQLSIVFLKSLMRRIHDYKVPTARGLILFGKEIKIASPLSITEKTFDESISDFVPSGCTPLWDAVDLAADEIIKFNPCEANDDDGEKQYKYPEAQSRIILISDADDTESKSDKKFSIAEKLVKNGIVMDVIMISTAEECRDAIVTSKITGGLSLRPENEEEGIEIFETEAFLDIKARSDFIPIDQEIDEENFNNINKLIGRDPYKNPNDIKNKFIKQASINAELSSVKYTLFYRKDERYQPKTVCERHIIKQLNRIKKINNPDIVVYTFQQELKKWRVFIKGPDGSPYEKAWWNLYVYFPLNYPISPPKFRFISVPYHQNVSPEGLLLFSKIDDGYEPQFKMNSILNKIRKLFTDPDDSYPIRGSLMDERNKDNASFVTKARASKSAFAKDDYHEYLLGVKVNEDIPKSGYVENDEEDEGDSIYVTTGGTANPRPKLITDFDDDDDDDDFYDDAPKDRHKHEDKDGDDDSLYTTTRDDGRRKLIGSSDDDVDDEPKVKREPKDKDDEPEDKGDDDSLYTTTHGDAKRKLIGSSDDDVDDEPKEKREHKDDDDDSLYVTTRDDKRPKLIGSSSDDDVDDDESKDKREHKKDEDKNKDDEDEDKNDADDDDPIYMTVRNPGENRKLIDGSDDNDKDFD